MEVLDDGCHQATEGNVAYAGQVALTWSTAALAARATPEILDSNR
jgi:hypothetical protein